ncbi:multidrug resistance-associated ABC transporter [Coprinopsis marcescibilis]|uniref:Multidrug resistance-associated ABC transporter n=1 Tax=Coprinopsis marcescibilis TaxID=230819 RepID=A0A5C3KNU3_COPMA|nr:multidrug resistance-associated ABC transporter [Coprinopsis marcescibilis]
MFKFQTEIGAVLVLGTLVSSLVLYLGRRRHHRKVLLQGVDGVGHGPAANDPLNIAQPRDLVDGYPVNEHEFWGRMQKRKMVLTALLTCAAVVNATTLGFATAHEQRHGIVVASLQLAYTVYTLLLSGNAMLLNDAGVHVEAVVHVSALSCLATLLLVSSAILPRSRSEFLGIQGLNHSFNEAWYILIVLYAAVFFVAARTQLGPPLYYPTQWIYLEKTVDIGGSGNGNEENVCGLVGASLWDTLLFSYSTKVLQLGGRISPKLEIDELPILPANMRAVWNYTMMRKTLREVKFRVFGWNPKSGKGWGLMYQLVWLNWRVLVLEVGIAAVAAVSFYGPAFFVSRLIGFLEREDKGENSDERWKGGGEDAMWGWVYVFGILASRTVSCLIAGQLWSLATTVIQVRFKIQLNTVLFAKTLVRKDIASSALARGGTDGKEDDSAEAVGDFSSKAQVMTLMTTDVDRVSEFAWHLYSLIDSPIEIAIGTWFLYDLLGPSCFFGLGVASLFLPLNLFAGKIFVGAQEGLMDARDERVGLTNEILGAIRTLKFMAWERNFEKRVLGIRARELKYQKAHYRIEIVWNAVWNMSPILAMLATFWHYSVVRGHALTPSVAFSSVLLSDMKYVLNALPEMCIKMLQCFVSLRRLEKYLDGIEVLDVPPLQEQSPRVAFEACSVTWPQEHTTSISSIDLGTRLFNPFVLRDLDFEFPQGEITLVCGKLGSGKTLLLLALLGEADVLDGMVHCARSSLPFNSTVRAGESWCVDGVCAYVPQVYNILFTLPYNEARYRQTLEACALLSDLELLEDGDESEIGERGVNLSGGQKARVSLARAVYSRASTVLLDDVLSAVDTHTAHHLYHRCLKGRLMTGRTVILVSHHVQLCAAGAAYIVALDAGKVVFQGDQSRFSASGMARILGQTKESDSLTDPGTKASLVELGVVDAVSQTSVASEPVGKKVPRKFVEEESREVGHVKKEVWALLLEVSGGIWYWILFGLVFAVASLAPVAENKLLQLWTSSDGNLSSTTYIVLYAEITMISLVVSTSRWSILYDGSIRASTILYRRLLEAVLFAEVRFHDTVSRGRLLNRFGKDFEGIDSNLMDNFGRTIVTGLSVLTTCVSLSVIGGLPAFAIVVALGALYFKSAYGKTSRDMRRMDSISRSPLYSVYGDTISGAPVLRAFGASAKLLREMLRCVDTNTNPYYWMWGVNRWLSIRFNLLSGLVVAGTGLVCLVNPSINASLAGFALAFASTVTHDLIFMVHRFVGLEQSMVALERVKEYTETKREAPEFVEPRPPASWPLEGEIRVENLSIRYGPGLPNVLHELTFTVRPGEKIGIVGRTGSGKSTLALSLFRFVEPASGRILIDGLDITKVGLSDLRGRITIIPQEPTILSGTIRSSLDAFGEYEDAELYESLRRVHLIQDENNSSTSQQITGRNVFLNLDSPVSESGDNISTGEKQLICMARAILKRAKILIMDEATASVDYVTDQLISSTIQEEFAGSTVVTIAHRLRTIIHCDRVIVLDQGRIVEFDGPSTLIRDQGSTFYALCKAAGKEEFLTLREMLGISS